MSAPDSGQGPSPWWVAAIKGLTISNVLVIAALVIIAIPAYGVYRLLNDASLLDRFLSSYQVLHSSVADCVTRTVKERGGPQLWSISTGFAYAGTDRWTVGVILDHQPTDEEVKSHCATLLLIVEKMHDPEVPSLAP